MEKQAQSGSCAVRLRKGHSANSQESVSNVGAENPTAGYGTSKNQVRTLWQQGSLRSCYKILSTTRDRLRAPPARSPWGSACPPGKLVVTPCNCLRDAVAVAVVDDADPAARLPPGDSSKS